ncbi:MAG: hypothetical protein ABF812_14395, partial [Gluconobacter cerinus]|uniref:hypothetical protein n=1 Tax=Gluconobacter cerinus TaxID=38307 RepID=UPI0039ED5297
MHYLLLIEAAILQNPERPKNQTNHGVIVSSARDMFGRAYHGLYIGESSFGCHFYKPARSRDPAMWLYRKNFS